MSNALAIQEKNLAAVESALVQNDLGKLSTQERLTYYKQVCDSVGLNHLTNPFAYITLNGKLTLYARKDATEQLRKIHGVSTQILSIKIENDFIDVHIKGKDKTGREDEDFSSLFVKGLTGENLANAKMKAITKAKRRVTLSICGLGILDESEIESIPVEAKAAAPQPQIANPFQEDDLPENKLESDEMPDFGGEERVPSQDDLSHFVCRVGKKYTGKTLAEIGTNNLIGFINSTKKWFAENNKTMSSDWIEFINVSEAYLCSCEIQPEASEE